MKLQEIRETLDALEIHKPDEHPIDYAQRFWAGLPRMTYKELPASLQKNARERFTVGVLRDFLNTCYSSQEYENEVLNMTEEERANLPSPPESYVSFETITAGIPAKDLDNLLIRTRNTAIYTVEYESPGQPAPMLYGNYATEAFENIIDAYKERQEEKHKQKQAKEDGQKPQRPQRAGTLVSGGYYQYVISDKKYQHGLTTQQNKYAYIALMQPDFFNQLDFKDGTFIYDGETAGIVKKYSKGKYTDVQELDIPLLTQIYTAAVRANIRHDAYTITVSLPQFFREMGVEVQKGNAPDIMEKLHSFEQCVGIMPGEQAISKLFIVIDLDMKNQTMTFAVPYIMRLHEVLETKNRIERKTRKDELIEYKQPYHNMLVHSSIVKERNKTAVELVYSITTGLLQRGYTPDIQTYRKKDAKTQYPDRITYSVRFRTLINDAPLLRKRIQSYKDTKDKNKALRRAFEKAFQLLKSKTDAGEWFVNLQYNEIIPTMTTLDDELIFTHDGRNGDYKPKK